MIDGILKEANDLFDAPVSVAEGTEHGQHHESKSYEIGVRAAREDHRRDKAYAAQNRLLLPVERRRSQKDQDRCSDDEKKRTKNSSEQIFAGADILPHLGGSHRSLQRTPRKVVVAAAERLLTQLARLAKSSATVEFGA